MYRPQKLVAALFSAALLCTTGIALADKGGNHGNPHGGPPGQSGAAPGQNGMQGPASLPGQNSPQGRALGFQGNLTAIQGGTVDVRFADGATSSFRVSSAVLAALKAHPGKSNLIFFTTNGTEITAVSFPGEKSTMRVVSRSGNIFTLQSADGQSRLIALDAKTIARLHVNVGSNLQITTDSANGGKIVALDLIRVHQFDKFAPGRGTAAARQAAQLARMDAAGRTPPGLPHQCINPAGNTRGWCKSAHSRANGEETAQANAANGRGKCGPGSSRNGNPAFANQMAKDAANDASGHNPPGLPHECVNPAGHTRGFCKSSSSENSALCGSAVASAGGGGGVTASNTHGGIGASTARGSERGPGAPVGFIPVGGGTFGSSSASRAVGPTHVLGAAVGPTGGRRVAALPTRVLPVAIQPVGKRRCVWYKTGVLGASTGGYRITGTSATGGKPVLHKKCR